MTYEQLSKKITVTQVSDTEIIQISVVDPDAKLASNITNKIAEVFANQVSDIYNLDDLNNNIIVNKVIGPQKEEEYTLRFWISKNTLTQEADMHFHGIIEVVEDGNDVAKAN